MFIWESIWTAQNATCITMQCEAVMEAKLRMYCAFYSILSNLAFSQNNSFTKSKAHKLTTSTLIFIMSRSLPGYLIDT